MGHYRDYSCRDFSECGNMLAVMNSRWLFLCRVLLAVVFATAAYAEGTYQRTKDRKTLVWNSDPRPGDSATWSGARDEHGYATGYGTLTWFTAKPSLLTGSNIPSAKYTVFGRYSGNMIQGKLDGPVTLNVKGNTFHAAFEDGNRDTDWYAGPAIAPGDGHHSRVTDPQ